MKIKQLVLSWSPPAEPTTNSAGDSASRFLDEVARGQEWSNWGLNGRIGEPFSIDSIDRILHYRKTIGVCMARRHLNKESTSGLTTSGFKKVDSQLDFLEYP